MAIDRAALQAALDDEIAVQTRRELYQLFNGMFTGQKNVAQAKATFHRGLSDWIEAHRVASTAITELLPEKP